MMTYPMEKGRLERHLARMTPDRAARLQRWGKSLQDRINEREINQSELAARAAQFTRKKSMGRDLISNYIRGMSEPTPLYQIAMARALNVTVEELMAPLNARSSVLSDRKDPIEMHSAGSDRARLKIDIELPMAAAVEILRIIDSVKPSKG